MNFNLLMVSTVEGFHSNKNSFNKIFYRFLSIGSPVLLVPPENTIVRVGNTANLSCSYLANPNDGTIHWKRGDINLPSTSNNYNITADGTLIIRETTDDDSGEYRCTVTNSKGNVTAKANLTVISKFMAVYNIRRHGTVCEVHTL